MLLIGKAAEKYKAEIESKYSVKCLVLPEYEKLEVPVSKHADTLVFQYDNKTILTFDEYYRKNSDIFAVLSDIRVNIMTTKENVGNIYPDDILLNGLCIDSKVYGRCDKMSTLITDRYENIQCRQGYARCSCLKVNDRAVITADVLLAKKLTENGVNVLLISQGNISLESHAYGFIGGASFVTDERVFFFGDILTHPDKDRICAFIKKYGKELVCLGKTLTDCGGAVYIEE